MRWASTGASPQRMHTAIFVTLLLRGPGLEGGAGAQTGLQKRGEEQTLVKPEGDEHKGGDGEADFTRLCAFNLDKSNITSMSPPSA